MSDKKISQLDLGSTLALTDLVLIITDPTNTKVAKKCTIANLITAVMNYSGVPFCGVKFYSGPTGLSGVTGVRGDLYSDKGDGFLKICTVAGTPGTWTVVGMQS